MKHAYLLAAVLLAPLAVLHAAEANLAKPNIVIFLVDDMGVMDTSVPFLTEALTIEANARVAEAVTAGKPFFLNFAHYAVHAPFNADPRFAKHYQDSGKPPQAQAFATLIEGMDKSLGDVLDHLDALGVADNTLIFFLGDNGSDAPLGHQHEVACAAPLRGKKGAHYEGGMRVPFIAGRKSWPGVFLRRAGQAKQNLVAVSSAQIHQRMLRDQRQADRQRFLVGQERLFLPACL